MTLMFAEDPVQVQLISDWWEPLVPLAACGVALLSLGLTLWFRFGERIRLEVKILASIPVYSLPFPQEGVDRTNISVTNRSRTASTEISNLVLELEGGESFVSFHKWMGDDELPKRLEPGASCQISYDSRQLGLMLNGEKPTLKWIRGRAVSGHKTVRGKKSPRIVDHLRKYAALHPEDPWEGRPDPYRKV